MDKDGAFGCFGMHTVDSKKRVQGEVPMEELDLRFAGAMENYEAYQPLMDQSTVLWTKNLSHVARRAEDLLGSNGYLVLEWFDLAGQKFYSILCKVAGQMNCVEIVGVDLDPRHIQGAVRYNGTRYTHHVFKTAAI